MKCIYKFLATLAIVSCTLACTVSPFVTNNPDLKSPNELQVISICYSASTTSRNDIIEIAVKECVKKESKLKFWRQDRMFNECPVFAKIRVSFLCVPNEN